MLEVLLGLFILIIAVGFALLPLIAVVLFFIYIVAPNLLGFETKRNSKKMQNKGSNELHRGTHLSLLSAKQDRF